MRSCEKCRDAAFLLAAAAVVALVAPGCARKKPRGEEESRSLTVWDEVVRENPPQDLRSELIPLDSAQRYVPPGGTVTQDDTRPAAAGGRSQGGKSGPGRIIAPSDSYSLDELLDLATQRQSCNLVTGCESEKLILLFGAEAVQPIIERYKSLPRSNYQKFHLLEMLGSLGDRSAVPFLTGLLAANHWNARANAAMAIGRIRATEQLDALYALMEKERNGRDFGFLYALAFAVERLGGTGGKEILLAGLAPQSIASRNWGFTRQAVLAARELGLDEACALLRPCIEHDDVFLKKEALRAVAGLSCGGEELARAVAKQLSARVPSIRREASETLWKRTGLRFETLDQWEKYAKDLKKR
jgi:hypothetical protein